MPTMKISKPGTTVPASHAIASVLAKPVSPSPMTTLSRPAPPPAPMPVNTSVLRIPTAPIFQPSPPPVHLAPHVLPMASLTPPARSSPPASAPVFRAPAAPSPQAAPMPKLMKLAPIAKPGATPMPPIGRAVHMNPITNAQKEAGFKGFGGSPSGDGAGGGVSNDFPAASDAGDGFGGGFYPPGYDPTSGGDDSALPPDPTSGGSSLSDSPSEGGDPPISPVQAHALTHGERLQLLARFVAYYAA